MCVQPLHAPFSSYACLFILVLDFLLCIFTLAGLHAVPVEKALKKGGVQAIASCKDCGPTADMLTAVDEGADQVINGKQYIPQRFHLIFVNFHHLPSPTANC